MRRFRLSPQARQDIRDIWSYIARDSVEAAMKVREELRDSCQRLAQRPYLGHVREDLTTQQGIRFWPVYSYLIVYRPGTRPIDILRVLHGRRDFKNIIQP